MDTYPGALRLVTEGRYRTALEHIQSSGGRRPGGLLERRRLDLLHADILEKVGRQGDAQLILDALLKARDLTDAERGRCEFVLSRIHAENGTLDLEVQHLQRAISYAQRSTNLDTLCWAQLRLLAAVADTAGSESTAPLLSTLRNSVIKLGDPRVTSAMHLIVAELDGKRGLLDKTLHHATIAANLLGKTPNLWLEAWTHNVLLASSILKGDLFGALKHGQQALASSTESGVVAVIRLCLGNLGNLHLARGEFDEAVSYFCQAEALMRSTSEQVTGCMESRARIYLFQGRFEECQALLDRIIGSVCCVSGVGRYVHRYSLFTKANLCVLRGLTPEALSLTGAVIDLAETAGDEVLRYAAKLLRLRVMLGPTVAREAAAGIADVLPVLMKHPLQLGVHYESALAYALECQGRPQLSKAHLARSLRICVHLGDRMSAMQLTDGPKQRRSVSRELPPMFESVPGGQVVLQDAAALMMHAGRPELLATDLVALLASTGSVDGAQALAHDQDASHSHTLATHGSLGPEPATRTFALGTSGSRRIEVVVRPRTDIESLATLNAVAMLLGAIRQLEEAQADREDRLTLWPTDELPDSGDAVMIGRMRNLMADARKAARSKVVVLITGESGTGKEVLARAIHRHSPRAHKPFVPFNCTAVPRELLESQLFGFRRGAFTGADRDNQGLIRAAQDGTLFFDEIGELGLDLQPKLLRFMESGEISPLGELAPLVVDVRIIAATNANLEQLVEAGRFREDLYYRLNVIPIAIPPLRERRDEIPMLVHHFVALASAESGKGHLRVAEETMEQLLLYDWPGNVRQLQNELRRMVAMADPDSVLTPSALSDPILRATPKLARSRNGVELVVPLTDKLIPTLSKVEGEMIKVALKSSHGKVEAAARALGISRKGLYLKRQRLGL